MRVQTYAIWVHRHNAAQHNPASAQRSDDVAGFIDGLIAQMTYYPSFVVQITPDRDGLLLEKTQRVLHTDEQRDGMVAVQTDSRNFWITHADYERLLS